MKDDLIKEEFEKLLKPFDSFDIKYIAPYKNDCEKGYIATIIDNENSHKIIMDMCTRNYARRIDQDTYEFDIDYGYCQIIDNGDRYNIFCGSMQDD